MHMHHLLAALCAALVCAVPNIQDQVAMKMFAIVAEKFLGQEGVVHEGRGSLPHHLLACQD